MLVAYTGAAPPEWVVARAAEHGIELQPLGTGGAEVVDEEEAAQRLTELRPSGYLMNDPSYGPYLSRSLADQAPELGIVVYIGQTLSKEDYEPFMDVFALRERGVVLTTGPGTATVSVAEGTLALLLALSLDLVAVNAATKVGRAYSAEPRRALHGSVLGVVGLGSIGQRVARLAAALGMRIVYSSRARRLDAEDELQAERLALPDLFERSHAVTIHTPLGLTQGLIGRDVLSRASGIALVNTASPGIVDPDALLEALERGWVRRAAFDGRYGEPHRTALHALGDERFVVLPFVSWNTTHTHERGWEACLESLIAFAEGRDVPYQLR